jgi:hypothetical protein
MKLKKNNNKSLLFFLFLVIAGCINLQYTNNQTAKNKITNEDFNTFSIKFYADTIFQQSRILKPLKGIIKYWNDNETVKEKSWGKNKITITSKEIFLKVYKNLKTELILTDTLVTEKYWLEQSGFHVEKQFLLKEGNWYLYRYDISNL